ncbi:hypothetical protein HZH66_005719 [Vespula vulgaris]|uniref:Uncharacterized protein n=1 Tax=Vespula vulgaris TaxID=7454 RepID=A0A834N989_VESVU|nr:hypothetical protein HZH66_005719 [Vespula vulgaris]
MMDMKRRNDASTGHVVDSVVAVVATVAAMVAVMVVVVVVTVQFQRELVRPPPFRPGRVPTIRILRAWDLVFSQIDSRNWSVDRSIDRSQATEWDTYDTLTLTSFCNRHEDIIDTDRIELGTPLIV